MQRSTLRLEDDLMQALKERAHRESTSVTQLINQAIRSWLFSPKPSETPTKPFKQKTYNLGFRFDINRASAIADELEDEERLERLAMLEKLAGKR